MEILLPGCFFASIHRDCVLHVDLEILIKTASGLFHSVFKVKLLSLIYITYSLWNNRCIHSFSPPPLPAERSRALNPRLGLNLLTFVSPLLSPRVNWKLMVCAR